LDDWDIHHVPDSYNNEYQYYTNRADNVWVEDGYLKIRPMREQYEHREYTSGKITSKHHYQYGRVEIRAKHPKGRGIWPAIWMMPQEKTYGSWPASGEIDIFEGRGQTPTMIQSAIHWGKNPDNHDHVSSGQNDRNTDITDSFHIYRVDWLKDTAKFYFDGKKYYEINLNQNFQSDFYDEKRQPFDHAFYLILNVAVGGDFLEGPDANDLFAYPYGEMWVDWVKWYTLCDLGWGF
jgi:beta-glucanase (GH16 family)